MLEYFIWRYSNPDTSVIHLFLLKQIYLVISWLPMLVLCEYVLSTVNLNMRMVLSQFTASFKVTFISFIFHPTFTYLQVKKLFIIAYPSHSLRTIVVQYVVSFNPLSGLVRKTNIPLVRLKFSSPLPPKKSYYHFPYFS